MKDYKCCVCGKKHVKLWRPYGDDAPLICAECAEKRQTPQEYEECSWKKDKGKESYTGTYTGRILPLPKWRVNEKGLIPINRDPGPIGMPKAMTDQLIVNLSGISSSYTLDGTTLIPASPTNNGEFWSYTCIPEEVSKWWENLPTR